MLSGPSFYGPHSVAFFSIAILSKRFKASTLADLSAAVSSFGRLSSQTRTSNDAPSHSMTSSAMASSFGPGLSEGVERPDAESTLLNFAAFQLFITHCQ
jgi:hypothetical protein